MIQNLSHPFLSVIAAMTDILLVLIPEVVEMTRSPFSERPLHIL